MCPSRDNCIGETKKHRRAHTQTTDNRLAAAQHAARAAAAQPHAHIAHTGDRRRPHHRLWRAAALLRERNPLATHTAACSSMVRESGNASARTRQQARAKRSQCACSAASSGSMCDARGSCVTRVVCAPSGPAPRGWPSGVDCRRRTYVARATAVVPATRPSPDVETAVEKGEMSERPHHSHQPSSPIGPQNEKGLNFAPW